MFAKPSGSMVIVKYSANSRVPLAQPVPLKQMVLSCIGSDVTCVWVKVGAPERALVVWAKKSSQSKGATAADILLDPSHVISTTPGLPATTQGITAVLLLAP